jgi:hypothetical protein
VSKGGGIPAPVFGIPRLFAFTQAPHTPPQRGNAGKADWFQPLNRQRLSSRPIGPVREELKRFVEIWKIKRRIHG